MKKYSYFTQNLYDEILPDGIEYHYWNVARFKIINQFIKKIAITIKGISIGCGIGVDVKLLRDYDIDVIGVEPSNVKPIETIKKYIKTTESHECHKNNFKNMWFYQIPI